VIYNVKAAGVVPSTAHRTTPITETRLDEHHQTATESGSPLLGQRVTYDPRGTCRHTGGPGRGGLTVRSGASTGQRTRSRRPSGTAAIGRRPRPHPDPRLAVPGR